LIATDARNFSNLVFRQHSASAIQEIKTQYFPLKEETEAIIHFGFEVHKTIGFGFLKIVYKDALEYEFIKDHILFVREKEYGVQYKDSVLRHKFCADFIIFDSGVLEVKTKEGIAPDDMAQMINYLKCSACKVGLILNFVRNKLDIKRTVF
jgi:GxxExxY protein